MNLDKKPGLLGSLLKNVSRSFYLTLRVLPGGLREPIGLAYLLARAADTIADTALLPPDRRLELLLNFRAQVNGAIDVAKLNEIAELLGPQQANPHEKVLLQSLAPALELLETLSEADRHEVRWVVTMLTQGMEFDLRTFPPENAGKLVALKTTDELERYTYYVAGCVGEFWTKLTMAHTPALRDWQLPTMAARGVHFGKALQYTNVLRDCPKDLAIGRCYLPSELLAQHGLTPEELLAPHNSLRAQPVLHELQRRALEHYCEALGYILAIPSSETRLRLACIWPVVIGVKTMNKLAANDDWLDRGKPSKVSRLSVYGTILKSFATVKSDSLTRGWIKKLLQECEAKISVHSALAERTG